MKTLKPLKETTLPRLSDEQLLHCVQSGHPSAREALATYKTRVKNRTLRKLEKLVESLVPEIVEQEHRLYALEAQLSLAEALR